MMSDRFQDRLQDASKTALKPASKSRFDDTINRGIGDATPRWTLTRSKQQQQTQTQPQTQMQNTTESHTKRPIKKQHSKPWSPETARPIRLQPALPLQCKDINTPDWTQAVIINSRPKYLDAPIILRNDGDNGLDVHTEEIRKQLKDLRFTSEVSNLCAHPRPELSNQSPPTGWNDPPYPWILPQFNSALSPEISPPKHVDHGPSPSSTATSPVHSEGPQSPTFPPHYASLFRPRISSIDDLMILHSPIPDFHSVEQAVMIREALTRFHMGVLLVDEWAGENKRAWFSGLRSLVEEDMPGLRYLGVIGHQIVFYYHGRGDSRVGNDVWDAIMVWDMQQHMEMQRRRSWSSGAGDTHKQEVVSSDKQEDLEQKERELRQKESSEQKEAEHKKIRRTSKEAQKWNEFAKQEASKSLVHNGITPRLGWIYEDEEKDDRGIIW